MRKRMLPLLLLLLLLAACGRAEPDSGLWPRERQFACAKLESADAPAGEALFITSELSQLNSLREMNLIPVEGALDGPWRYRLTFDCAELVQGREELVILVGEERLQVGERCYAADGFDFDQVLDYFAGKYAYFAPTAASPAASPAALPPLLAGLTAEDITAITDSRAADVIDAETLASLLRKAVPTDPPPEESRDYWRLQAELDRSRYQDSLRVSALLERALLCIQYQDEVYWVEQGELYALLRGSNDVSGPVDAAALDAYGDVLQARMDETLAALGESMPRAGLGTPQVCALAPHAQFTDGGGGAVTVYRFVYALSVLDPAALAWSGGLALDSQGRLLGADPYTYFAAVELPGQAAETLFLPGDGDLGADGEKHLSLLRRCVDYARLEPRPLTEAELARANEAFSPTLERDGVTGASPIGCFFTSHYDRPEELNLADFLRNCPLATALGGPEELDALRACEGFPFPNAVYGEDMPAPIHKIPAADVDALLEEYTGVRLAALEEKNVLYLPEYDAYYNFTSDFGAGAFVCASGDVLGNRAYLYGADGRSTLTLRREGERWYIEAFV